MYIENHGGDWRPAGFGIAKLRLFGQSAKIVCSGFTEVCKHFILFWRICEKLVILHPKKTFKGKKVKK